MDQNFDRHLRALHQPGRRDLQTAVAMLRAAVSDDTRALLDVARGVGDGDDLLGIAILLAKIGGESIRAAEAGMGSPTLILDALARMDHEAAL